MIKREKIPQKSFRRQLVHVMSKKETPYPLNQAGATRGVATWCSKKRLNWTLPWVNHTKKMHKEQKECKDLMLQMRKKSKNSSFDISFPNSVERGPSSKVWHRCVPNSQTVVWLGLPESFVHNLALSFAQKHLFRWSFVGALGLGGLSVKVGQAKVDSKVIYSH